MKKKSLIIFLSVILICTLALSIMLGVAFGISKKNIDFSLDEKLFVSNKGSNITRFYASSTLGGTYSPIQTFELTPDNGKKEWYPYGEIGDNLKDGFIAVEDQSFFTHKGVDIKRTLLAAFNYVFKIKPTFGASTITQQVIKNISGDNERSASRKLSEIIRAINIEYSHSKEEIFELYLNIVPMGEGVMGVGLASEHYFGKTPAELTNAEAATLIGITNAPSKYNPHNNPNSCLEKRNRVLYIMHESSVITTEEYEEAKNSPLVVLPKPKQSAEVYSWFVETVMDELSDYLVKNKNLSSSAAKFLIKNGGLSIYTTENTEIQGIMEEYFSNQENFPKSVENGLNYSMVVCDSMSGNLLGIVGGVGKKKENRILNYATVPHTPGSSLKPIALYAPLLDKKKINWATVFDDIPIEINKDKDGKYSFYPHNNPDKYDGLTTVKDALRVSKNTVAVRLYELLGKENIYRNLKDNYGFDTLVDSKILTNGTRITDIEMAPLALGQLSYGISLRKLTEAYTVFSSGGELNKGRSFIAVYDNTDKLFIENTPESKRLIQTETARIMNQLLCTVTDSGTAKSIRLKNIVDTAGKTGTSGNDKDRLFIGYTPYFTGGIWCGYSGAKRSIGNQSVSHLEIWDAVMLQIHESVLGKEENLRSFSKSGLEYLPYCMDSGMLYSLNCMHDLRGSRMEYGYFTSDNKPNEVCKSHILLPYDKMHSEVANEKTRPSDVITVSLIRMIKRDLPPEIEVGDEEFVFFRDTCQKGRVETNKDGTASEEREVLRKRRGKRHSF